MGCGERPPSCAAITPQPPTTTTQRSSGTAPSRSLRPLCHEAKPVAVHLQPQYTTGCGE